MDLLLLGAPDGKTELVGGRVKRRLRMPSTAEARGAFKRLARDICHHYAVEWRNRFIDGKDTFDHDRMHLALHGEVVEVSVDVSASIWKTFT